MFTLAEELVKKGKTVLIGTTTKVWQKQARNAPQVILTDASPVWMKTLKRAIAAHRSAFIATKPLESGKLQGISHNLADELYRQVCTDYMLVEADGAAGKSIKAPAKHEPVVPLSASVVIAVIGADALGKPCKCDTVFRVERFMEITGSKDCEIITPGLVAKLFVHEAGLFKGTPKGARRIAFINRTDLLTDVDQVKNLVRLLGDECRVIAGSVKEHSYLVYN